jgi:superoxide dismutase, Fe-Mn family
VEPRFLLAQHESQGRRADRQDQGRAGKSFGDLAAFKKAFSQAAVGQFGSGWAWLVKDKAGALKIEATSNADTPIAHGGTPLLVADVWEHAYYLDYQNRRPDYLAAWLDKLVNWSFAEENLS